MITEKQNETLTVRESKNKDQDLELRQKKKDSKIRPIKNTQRRWNLNAKR
jgi:hypothetical protein